MLFRLNVETTRVIPKIADCERRIVSDYIPNAGKALSATAVKPRKWEEDVLKARRQQKQRRRGPSFLDD
jgi:hypothetical protein